MAPRFFICLLRARFSDAPNPPQPQPTMPLRSPNGKPPSEGVQLACKFHPECFVPVAYGLGCVAPAKPNKLIAHTGQMQEHLPIHPMAQVREEDDGDYCDDGGSYPTWDQVAATDTFPTIRLKPGGPIAQSHTSRAGPLVKRTGSGYQVNHFATTTISTLHKFHGQQASSS